MDNRAVSETLGYILIFSVVIITITTVAMAGVGSLEASRDSAAAANARESMTLVADAGTEVHRGGSPGRTIPLSTAGGTLRAGEEVTFEVRVDGATEVETTFEPLVYEGNGAKYVWVGSALLYVGDGGASMLRAPDARLDDPLVLPIVETTLAGSSSVRGSSAIIEIYREDSQIEYDGDSDIEWTIDTVSEERAEAWERMDSECNIDESDDDTVVNCDMGSGAAIVRSTTLEVTLSV